MGTFRTTLIHRALLVCTPLMVTCNCGDTPVHASLGCSTSHHTEYSVPYLLHCTDSSRSGRHMATVYLQRGMCTISFIRCHVKHLHAVSPELPLTSHVQSQWRSLAPQEWYTRIFMLETCLQVLHRSSHNVWDSRLTEQLIVRPPRIDFFRGSGGLIFLFGKKKIAQLLHVVLAFLHHFIQLKVCTARCLNTS